MVDNEILLELNILKNILKSTNDSLKFRLSNDDNYDKNDLVDLDEDITFGKLLFSITKGLTRSDLIDMSDKDLLTHIRRIQVIEKE